MAGENPEGQEQPAGEGAAAARDWFLDESIDWTKQSSIDAAMAKAGADDGAVEPPQTMEDVMRLHGMEVEGDEEEGEGEQQAGDEGGEGEGAGEGAEAGGEGDEAAAAAAAAAEAAAAAAAAGKPAPAAAAAKPGEADPNDPTVKLIAGLKGELEKTKAELAAKVGAETAAAASESKAERDAALAEMKEELGETHPAVKAMASSNKRMDTLEGALAKLEQKAADDAVTVAKAAEANFHKFQLGKHKVLNEITGGDVLDPAASPQAAWAAQLSKKYAPLVSAGKITREQLYERVEAELRKSYPELEKKLYGATAKPGAVNGGKAKPAAGIHSLDDVPGGKTPSDPVFKGIAELNPSTMGKDDFNTLMKQLTE